MTSEPSTSAAPVSLPKNHRRIDLGHLSLFEKQCIVDMYNKMKVEHPEKKITHIVTHIVRTQGVARSTVYRTIREYKKTGEICEPKQLGGRPSIIKSLDDQIKSTISEIVHSFFDENEHPTLDKILKAVEDHPDIPKMSRSTLYTFIKQIEFK